LVRGWSASRSSGGKSPNVEIAYQPAIATSNETRPAGVTVRTLKDDGSYATTVTLYDGLMREVQQQAEAHGPGRTVVDTTYNDHGLPDEVTSAYLAKGEPEAALFTPRSKTLLPAYVRHRYDGMGREVRSSIYHDAAFRYSTITNYEFGSTYVNPAGSTAPRVRTYYDALGRVTSIKHYAQEDPSSLTGRTTKYEYDGRGYRYRVTDPAGNVWSYVYDARGRVTSATDPDTGTTSTWYDAADRPNRVHSAREQETFTEYDLLGRVKAVREGSATATPTKEFSYDTAAGGIGRPASAKRHTDTGDYLTRVTAYDADDHPTAGEIVIPSNPMTTGLAGTYAYSYTYTPTGKPQSITLPAAGGLAQEKVVTRYNTDGLPESTSGLNWYTSDATYSPYGEVLRTASGSQPYRVWTTNFVDPHTGRLQRTVADRETAGPHRITDSYYSYDVSGTITSHARKLSESTGDTWDTQCFTYDVMGELVNAWTSNITPDRAGTGCKASNGTTWGYRTDYVASSGPVADAPDAAADTTSPDTALSASLSAAAPDTASVSTGTTAYRQSYVLDWLGNRATMTEHNTADATKNVTFTYSYGKTVTGNGTTPSYKTQPHILAWVSSTPSGQGSAYTYDAAGNTTVRDLAGTTQNLSWTPENKLDSITDDGQKTTYVYDADGNRLLENSASGSTLYLGETELTTNATGTITRASRSYTQAGAPTVVRTTSNGATTGHKLNVLIADHLGTANTTVELSGTQPVTRRAFKPYGELRGPKPSTWPNKRSYLGVGIDDATTGLTHIGAREYDQTNGRFISADPLLDITDPLQMNGYSYAKNSPVSTSDPDGMKPVTDCWRGCKEGNSVYRDWVVPGSDGGWSTRHERSAYSYDAEGDLHSVTRTGSYRPPLGTTTVIKPYNLTAQNKSLKFVASLVTPDVESWKKVLSGEADGWDYFGVASDLPFAKVLKLVPDSVVKKGRGAVENWLKKFASGCKCFLAGTQVLMADGKTEDIEKIEVGDEVVATDPETGETRLRKVTRLIVTEDDKHFNELTIETPDGPKKLTATHEHPFWVPEIGAWVEARNLAAGTTLRTPDGTTVRVISNRAYTKHARTYNLTVDDLHTYYVLAGETPVLVHNSGPCPKAVADAWHEGTFDNPGGSFEYHWGKHGSPLNVTREKYLKDSSGWAQRLAEPGGKKGYNAKRMPFDDGKWGVKYSDPNGGMGGIIGPDGRVVSFWYDETH
jgi:RHS repeat-associated protein